MSLIVQLPSRPPSPLIEYTQEELLSPLEKNLSILSKAICEECTQQIVAKDPRRIVRLAIKAICLVISAGAKIPYIPISLTLPIGPAFAFGNTTSFFILEWWAIRATIDEALGPRGESEKKLIQNAGRGAAYQIATLVGALVISIFPQIPIALPALDYDGEFKIPGFFILIAAGVFIPIRSLQLTVDNVVKQIMMKQLGKKIHAARLGMMGLIQEYRDIFRQASYDNKLEIMTELNMLRSPSDLYAYLGAILEPTRTKRLKQDSRICKHISLTAAVTLTAAFEAALVMYTWEKTKEHFTDSEWIAGSIAITTGVSWLYLTGQAIIGTTQRVGQSFIRLIRGEKDPSIASQIYPKLTFALKSLGLINTVLALGPTVVIWGEFFDKNIYEQVGAEVVMCSSLFLLLSTATMDIIEDFVQKLIQSRGQINDREIANLDAELSKMQQLLGQSTLLDTAAFLMDFPEEMKDRLLNKIALTQATLDEFLEKAPLLN